MTAMTSIITCTGFSIIFEWYSSKYLTSPPCPEGMFILSFAMEMKKNLPYKKVLHGLAIKSSRER